MKPHLTIFFVLICNSLLYSQEINYTTYSYSTFFSMIENEQDPIFKLEHAIIQYDSLHDADHLFGGRIDSFEIGRMDTIFIHKELELNDVHFASGPLTPKTYIALHHIAFEKKVRITDTYVFYILNSTFKDHIELSFRNRSRERYAAYRTIDPGYNISFLAGNKMLKGFTIDSDYAVNETSAYAEIKPNQFNQYPVQILINKNKIFSGIQHNRKNINFDINNLQTCHFNQNEFSAGFPIQFFVSKPSMFSIDANVFDAKIILSLSELNPFSILSISENKFNQCVFLNIPDLPKKYNVGWGQLDQKVIEFYTYQLNFFKDLRDKGQYLSGENTYLDAYIDNYLNHFRIENDKAYEKEISLRFNLHEFYKSKYQVENANAVYRELKDLQTERLKYIYTRTPTFETYFTWRINQFLKLFSAYGTKPAKAVVFSLYVIFFFALIYLFFPNSWDRHGKNRIVDRYSFFMKYMNRKAGIHEVYLEEKQPEIMAYDAFRNLILNSEEKVPRFFTATALPLYKWAISGTQVSARILKSLDIMKGTWRELPPQKRIWKTILLIGAFTIAIIYDLCIKMLNAIMLSINTFTTLGFGEIPIRGLPRYLAIIQGFIGWFMLTIFSVSLISQLLN